MTHWKFFLFFFKNFKEFNVILTITRKLNNQPTNQSTKNTNKQITNTDTQEGGGEINNEIKITATFKQQKKNSI